jgi:chromosomal replication initiator protein
MIGFPQVLLDNPSEIWTRCLQAFRDRVPRQSFETWLRPTKLLSFTEKSAVIKVPNAFFSEWIEQHYLRCIQEALRDLTGSSPAISFSVSTESGSFITNVSPPQQAGPSTSPRINNSARLNSRYTFDNFVVGDCNQFAHAASLAVAEAPGKTSFNPLVIYGGVGLGKTHLIQAIGHFVVEQNTAKNLVYVSSERFTIDFIDSIQNNKTSEFSNRYRNMDVLLVDDIQFFSDKERTQEEFFHTFNALHQKGKQIVLSSDRPPKEIRGLEERLLSRFQWGLIADIQRPDLETRIAILQKKAQNDNLSIPSEVTSFIANNITTNIRDLEGAVIRLLAYSSLTGKDISLGLAREVIKDLVDNDKTEKSVAYIQKVTAEHLNISVNLMCAKKKTKEVALARQIAMYLTREFTNHSLTTIGDKFGGRDHSTVIHACRTVERLMENDPLIKTEVGELIRVLSV